MPTTIRVIHSRDFIRARPDGVLDMETAEKLMGEIVSAAVDHSDLELLIDTRRAQGQLGAADLWFLAERLARHRAALNRKIAVLCPTERFDRASFFAMCAENRGFNIAAFTSYEDAMDWLMGDAEA